MPVTVQTKLLRKSNSPEDYLVYQAGLEWDLEDPIVIESKADFRSEPAWRGLLKPYNHQVNNLVTYCRRLPVTLLADDVGLGKTISAGLIISELQARGRLERTLIVCPKLLGPQWQEELESKFGIKAEVAIGQELREAAMSDAAAVITTYHSARLYLDSFPKDAFQMLILDEAHKLRNLYGVESPPQVAIKFQKALQDRRFRFVLMLTATPIHNRLWDIYSLVDLLTVARGHKNPFGTEGMFARRFIADDRGSARQLKAEAKDDFRQIVYSYMSRVRRADAKLSFPDRVVLMHRTDPTPAEKQLIAVVAKHIEKMNRLAQISILQALASSPDALRAQLDNMDRNGTIPAGLAPAVREIVRTMPMSAKLTALAALADNLAQEDPVRWRMVVFTTRKETQTTIEDFMGKRGWKVALINGDTTARNRNTLARFRENPPAFHVIVSTEAGSEGVNLQVANVVVNYDLPWNPMIVEQRIGRVQRLASVHAKVSIYNVMLRGTFEEYIVGRLLEKLQMASHAIGDIESLLEATGMDDGEDSGEKSFEEKIRQLVVASLLGQNVQAATKQAEESIQAAQETLERERESIEKMLGDSDGGGYVGPQPPKLEKTQPCLDAEQFVLRAHPMLGATVRQEGPDLYRASAPHSTEYFRFQEQAPTERKTVRYAPNTPSFQRLVDRVVASGLHSVEDADENTGQRAARIVKGWLAGFGGTANSLKVAWIKKCAQGDAALRVRATVAHDAYEKLVRVPCEPADHAVESKKDGLDPLPAAVEDPRLLGVRPELLASRAEADPSIAEFSRFYKERRAQEIAGAGDDERKRKRLEDEFTPQLEIALVGMAGRLYRQLGVNVEYQLPGSEFPYQQLLGVVPHSGEVIDPPEIETCSRTGQKAPSTCFGRCEISHARVLKQLLLRSEASGRSALAEHMGRCSLSGKRLLVDELGTSAITGNLVDLKGLKTSQLSGRRAEPQYFERCAVTGVDALQSELAISEVSGRKYRADQSVRSGVSGKLGHSQELIQCPETKQWLLPTEAEQCATTGARVMPGVLESCSVTGKRVVPSQLETSAVSGVRALHRLFVSSSISGKRLLMTEAIASQDGAYCAPAEATVCAWGGMPTHPDNIRECALTGLPIQARFATSAAPFRLNALAELLNKRRLIAERTDTWDAIARTLSAVTNRKFRCTSSVLSPSGHRLAVVADAKELLGLRVITLGGVYDIPQASVVGSVAIGRHSVNGWAR